MLSWNLGGGKSVHVAGMALGGFHGANMRFLWVMLTLSLGRRGGQSWDSLYLKVCPSEIREHADLGMVVKFLHTGKLGCSMAQDELRGNKLSISLLSFAIFSSQMYALL